MKSMLLLLFSLTVISLHPQVQDTLYASDTHVVALVFPESIRQAITGTAHFTFSFNTEIDQQIGLLQGHPGANSNLLVITENGQMYSYHLQYAEEPKQMIYFAGETEDRARLLPTAQAFTLPLKPQKNKAALPEKEALPKNEINTHHRETIRGLSFKKAVLSSKRKRGLALRLRSLEYKQSYVYAVIDIANTSGIDFQVDYLNTFKISSKARRKSSFQKLPLHPIYRHRFPELILNGQTKRLVLVFNKFTFWDNEQLQLELAEKNGSRQLVLNCRAIR